MSQVYQSRHGRSYRPVRVPAREIRRPNMDVIGKMDALGGPVVVAALGGLAVLDGLMFLFLGLR